MAAPFTVRPAGPEDAAALTVLGPETFRAAFGMAFPPAFIDERMGVIYGFGRLREDLADPSQAWFLAEAAGEGVGFLALAGGPAPGCVGEAAPIELSRLYVRDAWQGHGPAFALMDAGIEEALARRARTLWLQAWEQNPKALAFYRAHGFHEAGRTIVAFGGAHLPHLVLTRPLG
jgi:GNAT superfamily N-acetyltransferase